DMTALAAPSAGWAGRSYAASVACIVLAVAVGGATALRPKLLLVLALGVGVIALVSVHPSFGAYLIIGLTPLTAGINRGSAVPVLRPSEALAVAVGAALVAGALVRRRTGMSRAVPWSRIELSIVAMAVCNSAVPMI